MLVRNTWMYCNQEEAMKDARRFTPPNQAGFTLLELLMVVIIIAILAAVALPQYLRVAERSRAGEALQNLASIRGSENRFRAADPANLYTTDLDDLDVEVPMQGANNSPGSTNWNFTIVGAAGSENVVATRRNAGNQTIEQDLTTGATCSSDPQYALPAMGGAC